MCPSLPLTLTFFSVVTLRYSRTSSLLLIHERSKGEGCYLEQVADGWMACVVGRSIHVENQCCRLPPLVYLGGYLPQKQADALGRPSQEETLPSICVHVPSCSCHSSARFSTSTFACWRSCPRKLCLIHC